MSYQLYVMDGHWTEKDSKIAQVEPHQEGGAIVYR